MIDRFAIGCAMVFALTITPAFAIDVDENSVVWGFDGQVVPNQVTPVSFDVVNLTPEPFDGTLSLRRSMGISVTDAPYIQPLFLSPGTKRRVTFTPYMADMNSEWTLVWGRKIDDRFRLPEPKSGRHATVVFVSDDSISATSAGVRRYNEQTLPTSAAAMQGLAAVLLDHVPSWNAPRRQAFIDWVRSGGELHLFAGPDGTMPSFTAELAPLNRPEPSFPVGAGTVHRHGQALSSVSKQWLKANVTTATRISKEDEPDDEAEATKQAVQNYSNAAQYVTLLRTDLDPVRSISIP